MGATEIATQSEREFLETVAELVRSLRCWQQDDIFCRDVTFSQFYVLDALAQVSPSPVPLQRLHQLLDIEKSTTTRLLAPLIRKKMVRKFKLHRDQRALALELLPAGVKTHRCLIKFQQELIGKFRRHVKDEAPILQGLRRFSRALRRCCDRKECC